MTSVTIRHRRLRSGKDQELTEIHGEMTHVGVRNTSFPAGSLDLRSLHSIAFGQPRTARRAIVGSVSSPLTYGNNVHLANIITGTTGTRAVEGIGAIGSPTTAANSGTVVSPFWAYGI